ncbi:MAG TPA: phosphodiesterase, partial [Clostridium sp.]|nr:phosphodiesterase [Clostridium sp.]
MGKEKVIVVADIHANIHALNVFLDYLKNENEDIKYILNLGDFIQEGPNPAEVFDIVMNDKRFINILGNN